VIRHLLIVVGMSVALPLWLLADLSIGVRATTGFILLAVFAMLFSLARRRPSSQPGGGQRRVPRGISHDGGFMPRREQRNEDDIETRHHPSW